MRYTEVLAAAVSIGVLSCRDSLVPAGTGITLAVVPSSTSFSALDAGVVRVLGPTNKTMNVTPGTTVTIDGLSPGSYTVALQGLVAGAVEYFGQVAGIQVVVGQTTSATVAFPSFVPVVPALPPVVNGATFTVSYNAVSDAVGYRVEAATDQAFTANLVAANRSSSQTSADLTAPTLGKYFVRVRATDPYQGVGSWSSVQAVQLQVVVLEGDLVITEIMANPERAPDPTGEWFEVYNRTATAIDMFGMVVRDDGSDSFTIGTSLVVPAGGYVVLGYSANVGTNGGVTVDYAYTRFLLANAADEIDLFLGSTRIDRVAYSTGLPGFPSLAGAAMSLFVAPDHLANDNFANWCAAGTPYGQGDRGTPGTAHLSC